jgi:hypothetical protein
MTIEQAEKALKDFDWHKSKAGNFVAGYRLHYLAFIMITGLVLAGAFYLINAAPRPFSGRFETVSLDEYIEGNDKTFHSFYLECNKFVVPHTPYARTYSIVQADNLMEQLAEANILPADWPCESNVTLREVAESYWQSTTEWYSIAIALVYLGISCLAMVYRRKERGTLGLEVEEDTSIIIHQGKPYPVQSREDIEQVIGKNRDIHFFWVIVMSLVLFGLSQLLIQGIGSQILQNPVLLP